MAEVRRVLGKPGEAVDISHYFSYPGDAAAECPLFLYDSDPDWTLYVYFAGPNMARGKLTEAVHRRLFSVDLIHKGPLHFPTKFPKQFTRKPTIGADAAWDEFSDGSGLCYSVYSCNTPSGGIKAGDLNRISYGPPPAELQRFLHE